MRRASKVEVVAIDASLRRTTGASLREVMEVARKECVVVRQMRRREAFLVSRAEELLMAELAGKSRLYPYAVGLYLGVLRGSRRLKLVPSLPLGSILARHGLLRKGCVYVDERGEKLFLYGRDLFASSIVRTCGRIRRGDLVSVLTSRNEFLGWGIASADLHNGPRGREAVAVRNLIDLGWYLRRGG